MAKEPSLNPGSLQKFITELSDVLNNGKNNIELISNYSLIKLFWKIGQELLSTPCIKENVDYDIFLQIEKTAVNKYGHFFEKNHLSAMYQFAFLLSDERLVENLSTCFDWSLILKALQLKTERDWIACVKDAIDGNIDSSAPPHVRLPSNPGIKKINQEKLASLFPSKLFAPRKQHLNSLYTGLYRHEFREILGIHTSSPQEGTGMERVLNNILKLIVDFRCSLSTAINSKLNLSFWHAGRLLFQKLNTVKTEDKKVYLEELALRLEQKWGREVGGESNLYDMLFYYQTLGESDVTFQVARLVNWEQLKELLYLQDPEYIHLSARMLARGDIDLLAIRQYINHEFPEVLLTKERALLNKRTPLDRPSESVLTKTKGNSKFTITERIINADDDIINNQFYVNLFSNIHFTAFMKSEIGV